jgi:putative membrane protein
VYGKEEASMGHGIYGIGMGGGLGLLSVLFFWVAIIVAIILSMKWFASQGQAQRKSSSGSAIEIIEKRYASGEISEKEFKKMKQNLKGGG